MNSKHRAVGRRQARGLVLAALLVGCTSSPKAARETEDASGVDSMVEADGGEDSAPPELDASVDEPVDASGGVDEGNGDAPDAGLTPDQEACAGTCAVTTSVAACPTPLANCIRRCERQFTAGICLVTLRALLRCQMGAGPDGYDCVLGGVTPKAGVCATEKKEDDDCLSGDAGT